MRIWIWKSYRVFVSVPSFWLPFYSFWIFSSSFFSTRHVYKANKLNQPKDIKIWPYRRRDKENHRIPWPSLSLDNINLIVRLIVFMWNRLNGVKTLANKLQLVARSPMAKTRKPGRLENKFLESLWATSNCKLLLPLILVRFPKFSCPNFSHTGTREKKVF